MAVRTWVSWSSGKDSAWTLWTLQRDRRYDVVGLLTTVTRPADRVSSHEVRESLVESQARAVGLPLHVVNLPSPCDNKTYEARMREALDRARAARVESIAYGDLFLEDVRFYRERMMRGSGIDPLFPLWGRDTTALAYMMVDGELEAIITCLDPSRVDPAHAGRPFDRAFLDALPAEVDPCAERGEFHTFAWNGPMFTHPVPCHRGVIERRSGFLVADLLPGAPG